MGKISAVRDSVTSVVHSSALAGKIHKTFHAFVLSQDDFHQIFTNVYELIHSVDLIVLCALGWFCVPAMGVVYTVLNNAAAKGKDKIKRVTSRLEVKSYESASVDHDEEKHEGYKNSYTYQVAVHISQMAKLALLVYLCDIIVVAMHTIGYTELRAVSQVFAKILYTSWIALRIQNLKTYFLKILMLKAPDNCDKVKLVNRALDLMVLALLGVKIMDYLSMETGVALTSLAAFTTTSTLIFSLASQDFAKGITTGIEMATSDRFYEGDAVHFGDGTQGFIVKMGFLRTKIRQYDGAILDIPNTQLGGQRLVNISKTNTCQVITKVRFCHDDIQKLPDALEFVKHEIKVACPKLILEGRPFRAKISSLEHFFVEVTINCCFTMRPTGDEFWANRQEMFLAIDRGVKKAGLKYAKPFHCQHDM